MGLKFKAKKNKKLHKKKEEKYITQKRKLMSGRIFPFLIIYEQVSKKAA